MDHPQPSNAADPNRTLASVVLKKIRNRHLFVSDLVLLAASPFAAYALRFESFVWSPADTRAALWFGAISLSIKVTVFLSFGFYTRLWRHASVADLAQIVKGNVISGGLVALVGLGALRWSGLTVVRVPISVVILDLLLTVLIVSAPRLLTKALHTWRRRFTSGRRTLVVGAGSAGEMMVRELRGSPHAELTPVALIDDDERKHGHSLSGVPVVGPLSSLGQVIADQNIEEVVIAMPTAPGTVVRDVLRTATDQGIPTRTVPGLFEIVSGSVSVSKLRNVEIQDLLRREPVETDLAAVERIVAGKVVLVTGAGGSIGSELARQLAELRPRELLLLGNCENDIFDILGELQPEHRQLQLTPVIADVRNGPRMDAVFARHRPNTVFHAAAHKHVPLMEANVAEAVTNNVLGTRNVVESAVRHETNNLVLISTDKAVRPSSVMGATKRAAELIVQHAARTHKRNFGCVRFGNVLGSRGSVIPTFLRQIEAGGPVTITHADMRRFFMTIPEAVQLVLQAGAQGSGGELFVLDMGEPVRVVDLATDLIRLSGREVGTDIELRYTGARPGERLHEEMFFRGEDVIPTEHPKILRTKNGIPGADVEQHLDALIAAAVECAPDHRLRDLLRVLVHEFEPNDENGNGRHYAMPDISPPARVDRPISHERRSRLDRRGNDRRQADRRQVAKAIDHPDRRGGSDPRWPGDRRSGIEQRATESGQKVAETPLEAPTTLEGRPPRERRRRRNAARIAEETPVDALASAAVPTGTPVGH